MSRCVYAFMLCAVLIFNGCDLLNIFKEEPVLTINKNELEVESWGGTCAVTVNANYDFEVVIPEDASGWLTSHTSGTDVDYVHFKLAANKGYEDRIAEVVIKLKEYELSETVTIVQKQTDAIVVDAFIIELSYEAGTFTIPVSSNTSYDISIGDTWIRRLETKGMVTENIVFAYEENESDYERVTDISFKINGTDRKISVRQKPQISELTMTVTHSRKHFNAPGFTGLLYSGTILWGDGAESDYDELAFHDYQEAAEVRVEFIFTSSNEEHVVTLTDMTGIKEIDLTGM